MQPDFESFKKLAREGNLIPLSAELLADMETPVSAFAKLTRGCRSPHSFLFESVVGGDQVARYSYLGEGPGLVLETHGREAVLLQGKSKKKFRLSGDPLKELARLMAPYKPVAVPGLPPFWGGLVGYLSYDAVRFFESIGDKNPDSLGFPETLHYLADTLVCFDHVEHRLKVVALAHVKGSGDAAVRHAYREASARLRSTLGRLSAPLPPLPAPDKAVRPEEWKSNISRPEFLKAVDRSLEYIRAGDIIQIQIGRRLSKRTPASGFEIYRQLRRLNPSPYMFYFQHGSQKLIGASPEILVKVEGRTASIRPIAGTRRRGRNREEDLAMEKELAADPKERAEHIQLVDLARNDLGRVAVPGSVKVGDLMVVERYSHVMHLVSQVESKLLPDLDRMDVLRSSFPAGTVAGSPKIRAMQIIDELENLKRGPYGGAIGFLSFSGDLQEALLIRTLMMDGNRVCGQASAGIVADSQPELEYKETENKLKAVLKAVELAEEGLK
jgi:anthranilate synthase component 1